MKNGFKRRIGTIITNEEGNLRSGQTEVIETRRKYITKLLNIQAEMTGCELIYHTVEPLVEEPSMEEVIKSIHRLKKEQSPRKR